MARAARGGAADRALRAVKRRDEASWSRSSSAGPSPPPFWRSVWRWPGCGALFLLPVAPLPNIDIPTIVVSASMAGASPEVMSTTRGDAAGAASGRHRRGHRNDLAQLAWARPRWCCNSTSAATSTARRATCRPRSTRRAPICRRRCAPIPPIASSIRPTMPIMILALTSKTLTPGQIYDQASNILQQKTVAGQRRGRCRAERRLAAGGAHRAQSPRPVQIRHRPGRCARRHFRPPTPTAPRAPSNRARSASRSMPTTMPPQASDYKNLIVAYRNNARGAAVGRRRRL